MNPLHHRLTLPFLCLALLAATRALAAPGDLDLTFGSGGRVPTSFYASGPMRDNLPALAVQADGKLVVIGSDGSNDFVVERYLPSGALDTGFGSNGKVTTAVIAEDSFERPRAVAVQGDDKILVAGYGQSVGTTVPIVVRYLTDGTLDTTFGGTGKVFTEVGVGEPLLEVVTMAVQSDGKIVLGGSAGANVDFVLVRYFPDGSLDTSFGGDGVVTLDLSTLDFVTNIAVQADDKIVVAGRSGGAGEFWTLLRCLGDGTLDPDFGTGGVVTMTLGTSSVAESIAVQADGNLVVVGSSRTFDSSSIVAARYLATGALDTSFGGTGVVTSSGEAYDVAIQGDGKIVVVGRDSGNAVVLRYFPNGTPDSGFGNAGRAEAAFYDEAAPAPEPPRIPTEGYGVQIQPDGKIVVVGAVTSTVNPAANLFRFLSLPPGPSVTTESATGLGFSSATLNGTLNGNGEAATAFFEYGTTASYGNSTSGQVFGTGTAVVPVQAALAGLTPNVAYHYRLVATGAGGTAYGADAMFTTDSFPPLAATASPTSVSATGATLRGAVNPRGYATSVHFEYGQTTFYGSTTSTQQLVAGNVVVDVSAPISSLIGGATYHCRIIATSVGGTALGEDVTFVAETGGGGGGNPTAPPGVTTGTTAGIGTTSVTLQGTVNPNGGATFARFDYGLTNAYGSTTTDQGIGNGSTAVDVATPVTGLTPGTTYHYRLRAGNSLGNSLGQDATITTNFLPPSATTDAAEPGTTFATLNGAVNPNGVATTVSFAYDTSPTLADAVTVTLPGTRTGTSEQAVSVKVTGLVPQTQYFYQVTATSSAGATPGTVESFTTLGAQAPVAVEDVVFTGGGNVSLNVIVNDVNTDTGEMGAGLTFDGIVRQGAHGQASGGPVVNFDPSGAFPLAGDSFDYRVKTAAGLTDEGTVTVLPFGAFKGGYGGTITGGTLTDAGLVTLELGPTGGFTGQLRWQNQKYALRDALESSGGRTIAKQKIGAANGVDLVLALQLDRTGLIFADLFDESSGTTLSFVLRRAAVSTNAVVGTYTATHAQPSGGLAELAPRGDGLGPQVVPGTGFTVGKVNKRKTAGRLVGRVGDSEPFSGGSRFFEDRLALNSKLYPASRGAGRTFGGSLTGDTQFNGDGTLTSVLEWVKQTGSAGLYPGGFRNGLQVTGERFASPGFGENPFVTILTLLGAQKARVEFANGDMAEGDVRVADVRFTLITGGLRARVLPGATMPGMNFKVNSQGVFSGAFTHPVTQARTRYFGTFRKNTGLGQGNFRGSTTAGSVRVFKAN